MTTGHVNPLLNPTNFPPRIDRTTPIAPGTQLILAADLASRDLTSAEKHGLHAGTHILITQDRVNQRFSTWDEIDHARAIVAKAIAEERRKATRAAELAQRGVPPAAIRAILPKQPDAPITASDLAAKKEHERELARQRKQRQRAKETEAKAAIVAVISS